MADRHRGRAVGATPLPSDEIRGGDRQVGDAGRGRRAGDARHDQRAVAVGGIQRPQGKRERVRGVRREFDTPGAVEHVERRDRLRRRGQGGTIEKQTAPLDAERSDDIKTQAAIHVSGAGIIQGQHAAGVEQERGSAAGGRAVEGFAGVDVA